MILAIEGLDGCGKSTVAKEAARVMGGTYVGLPPEDLRLRKDSFLENYGTVSRLLYYLAGVRRIFEISTEVGLVVADRYISSAYALHTEATGPLAEYVRQAPIPPPDLCIFLEVGEDERKRRLSRKADIDPFEVRLNEDQSFHRQVRAALLSTVPCKIIDTTELSQSEVAAQVVALWVAATTASGSVSGGLP